MSDVPDFIKEDQAEDQPVDANTLAALVRLFKDQKAEVDRLSAELADAQAVFNKTSREYIPELMRGLGYSEITLDTKEKLKVKEDASVSVPEEKERVFFDFLEQRGDQDIIKLNFAFPRMSGERRQFLMDLLTGNDFEFDFKEGVHPQTLKAYFKRLLGVGEEDRAEGIRSGKYLHPDVVKDFANIFTYYVTSITAPKGSKL